MYITYAIQPYKHCFLSQNEIRYTERAECLYCAGDGDRELLLNIRQKYRNN